MSNIKRTALVHYSPAEMYKLVNDVDAYASFLPWCKSSKVLDKSDDEMTASIDMARGILNQTFTTHNKLEKNHLISMSLVDGPFKTLNGYWQFDSMKTENACKVTLELQFEFNNTMISLAANPVFTQIANSLVDAFCKRAEEVYGARG